MAAVFVTLTASDLKNIAERLSEIDIVGERYAPAMMALVNKAGASA